MNILIIVTPGPRDRGPEVPSGITSAVRALTGLGHRVEVATPAGERIDDSSWPATVTKRGLPAPDAIEIALNIIWRVPFRRWSLAESLVFSARKARLVKDLAEQIGADLVVIDSHQAYELALATGRPIVAYFGSLLPGPSAAAPQTSNVLGATPAPPELDRAEITRLVRLLPRALARGVLRFESAATARREIEAARAARAVIAPSQVRADRLAVYTGRQVLVVAAGEEIDGRVAQRARPEVTEVWKQALEIAKHQPEPALRALFLNEYDMERALTRWLAADYPGQYLYGVTHFAQHGIAVEIVPLGRVGKARRWIKHRAGDITLQWHALLRCGQCDVIYAASPYDTAFLALLRRARVLRKPLVATLHHPAQGPFARPWLFRLVYGAHDRLLCMNDDIRDEAQRFGVKREKLVLVRWAVDLDFYEPAPVPIGDTTPMVLAAGKVKRDYSTLLEAVPDVDCRLEIYCSALSAPHPGSVPPNAEVHFDQAHPGSSEFLTMQELCARYRACTLVAIPLQASEVRGNSGVTGLLEAMAMGRAVLMTANGFMNIEQAGFGRRIAPGDVDGWREALREFTTDRHKADEMGRQARRVCAEEFSLPAYSSRVAAALRSAAEESPYRRGER